MMEGRMRKKWDNNYSNRRSHSRRPPRGNWQPRVPSWEKEFCKVVGALDWETLLQMKKFVFLYDDVINWDDSAGKEAFCNAKKRFWAERNGLSCDAALPDPNLYIDEVNWELEPDLELLEDLESNLVISDPSDHHDPVIIFGDALLPGESYSPAGWGDEDVKVPVNSSSVNHVDPWKQNWAGSFDNQAAVGWSDYSNTGWQVNGGSGNGGYVTWGGGWTDEWGWNYPINNFNYDVGHQSAGKGAYAEQGMWNDANVGGYVSSYGPSNVRWNDGYKNHPPRNDDGQNKIAYWGEQTTIKHAPTSREWKSFNSFAPIAVGQTWNQ